jgi:divalent metal cation (Fe/Co/Zn/Cd) transporter
MTDLSGPRTPELAANLRRARRLEWWSVAYVCSCVAVLALTMGGSQALKTEMLEDTLSLCAPVLFLIVGPISARAPDSTYPFGYERATSAGYLGAALALLATGLFLCGDGALKLIEREHPVIGGIALFGSVVWIGWLGIAALAWCAVPAWLLGRRKSKLAEKINDKGLLADAQTNTANWQSAGAAIVGILGVAIGLWWADAAAALFISLEIIRSGWVEVRTALADIMDRRPQLFGKSEHDPLPGKLQSFIHEQDWIVDGLVRVREMGREFVAEALIVPLWSDTLPDALAEKSDALAGKMRSLDPRLVHVAVVATRALPGQLRAVRPDLPDSTAKRNVARRDDGG